MTSLKSNSVLGFTLLEVMITLAIVAAVIGTVIPRLGNRNNEIKSTVREFSTLSKQLHNQAKLKNLTYRLVIELKDNADGSVTQTYWAESTQKPVSLEADRTKAFESRTEQEARGDKDKPYVDPDNFQLDKSILKEPKQLAKGLIIESIELKGAEEALSEGKVFIHYFPTGYTEVAAIHLMLADDISKKWTLATHPLTGKMDVVGQYVSLEDIQNQ